MSKPLTNRQWHVLYFIQKYIEEHRYAPTFEEIGAYMRVSSKNTIFKCLEHIEEAGYISRRDRAVRGIILLRDINGNSVQESTGDGGHPVYHQLSRAFAGVSRV